LSTDGSDRGTSVCVAAALDDKESDDQHHILEVLLGAGPTANPLNRKVLGVSNGSDEVEVQVKSLKTAETAKFKISDSATLLSVWDAAVTKLNEPKNAGDTFRCAKGQDLTGFLNQSLAQLQEQKVCEDRHFEIKGPSGGAIA